MRLPHDALIGDDLDPTWRTGRVNEADEHLLDWRYSLSNFVFDEMPGIEESQGNVLCLTLKGRHLLHWKLRTARIVGPFGEPRWE